MFRVQGPSVRQLSVSKVGRSKSLTSKAWPEIANFVESLPHGIELAGELVSPKSTANIERVQG